MSDAVLLIMFVRSEVKDRVSDIIVLDVVAIIHFIVSHLVKHVFNRPKEEETVCKASTFEV